MRSKACALINQHKPLFIRGSPPCTAFCRCQPLNVARYDWSEQGMRRRMAEGEVHLRVCCKIHRAQLQAGKHFLHEQPATAMSWALPEMQNLFEDGRLQRLVGDQCQLGQQTDRGQCMEKSTGWMSDSPVILRQLEKRCIGRGGGMQQARKRTLCHSIRQGRLGSRCVPIQGLPCDIAELCRADVCGREADSRQSRIAGLPRRRQRDARHGHAARRRYQRDGDRDGECPRKIGSRQG